MKLTLKVPAEIYHQKNKSSKTLQDQTHLSKSVSRLLLVTNPFPCVYGYVHDILRIRCELRKSKFFVSVKCTAHDKWKLVFYSSVSSHLIIVPKLENCSSIMSEFSVGNCFSLKAIIEDENAFYCIIVILGIIELLFLNYN